MNQEDWQNLSKDAARMKVDGGWIVCYTLEGVKSSFFVPDPQHGWKG